MANMANITLPSSGSMSYPELVNVAKQDSSLSWPEQLWWAHYTFWNNDVLATGVITFLAHELIYFGRCLPWVVADACPSVFRRFKIQENKAPSVNDQWTCVKYILAIHFIIELPMIVLFHPMMELCGVQYTLPFPKLSVIAAQIALFFIVEDTYHYWLHRAFHWGPLYRSIHRVHHQYAAPFGLTAEYASPAETFLLGLGTICPPLVLGYVTGNVHLITVLGWMALRQLQAIDSHSGYDFPWSLRRLFPFWGGADWHDDHHRYFWGNYSSSFTYWDANKGPPLPLSPSHPSSLLSISQSCFTSFILLLRDIAIIMAHPMRVIVRACVSDIPGNPQGRHIALGDAVCRDLLSRRFHATLSPAVYDHVHIPGEFDSELPLKRWFIFDLNVKEPLSRNDVTQLPHLVYRASRQGDEWIFISRDRWIETARSDASSFTWGGKAEQKLVSEMRKQSGRSQNTSHDAS
ncbi:sterol desaturase family protein [Aspergillus undulatus]|uniref:sterol desaturase family protein n=1 Tax=Aspergillus undulatus TaxID=1810928 RepID=UPI003CCD96C0